MAMPGSRGKLPAGIFAADFEDGGFASVRRFAIAGKSVTATRMSFVGELGWEIEMDNADARAVFAALHDAGAKPMGLLALEGCRIEKGFLHWGHELGPDITPLMAGLGFTIDWAKPNIATEALNRQKQEGVSEELVLLQVEGGPLLLHDEPVCAKMAALSALQPLARGGRGQALIWPLR